MKNDISNISNNADTDNHTFFVWSQVLPSSKQEVDKKA